MWDYLKPKDGPVVEGLEQREIVYAKNQPEYIPLRTLVSAGADRKVISRWSLTPEQRKAVADGADIYLTLLTFQNPLQPILMTVSDGKLDPDWVRVSLLDESLAKTV
jgi:hypothetical protein